MTAEQDLLTSIAQRCMFIDTLQRRDRDCFDFHEVSVWSIELALKEAYAAGLQQGLAAKAKPRVSKRPQRPI